MIRLSRVFPLLALFTTACFPLLGVQPVKVEGTAMLPALKDGDKIIVDRRFDKLERGDIVIFYYPEDRRKSYIKRIVGLPGETIEIRDGNVVINGTVIQEPYLNPQYNLSERSSEPVRLLPENYFVMGDNRDNSSDSRIWGPLHEEFIYGKYTHTYSRAK